MTISIGGQLFNAFARSKGLAEVLDDLLIEIPKENEKIRKLIYETKEQVEYFAERLDSGEEKEIDKFESSNLLGRAKKKQSNDTSS